MAGKAGALEHCLAITGTGGGSSRGGRGRRNAFQILGGVDLADRGYALGDGFRRHLIGGKDGAGQGGSRHPGSQQIAQFFQHAHVLPAGSYYP
ncbi:hypothetical protein D1872_300420 [compost metagenome]